MSDKIFLDTNIIIYCYSYTETNKQEIAQNLVSINNVIISTQVIKELTNVLRKKFKLEWEIIQNTINELESNFLIHTNTSTTIKSACKIAKRYKFSFYDSLVIAAALETECTILYSEDMQHEQIIEGTLTIRNPFV